MSNDPIAGNDAVLLALFRSLPYWGVSNSPGACRRPSVTSNFIGHTAMNNMSGRLPLRPLSFGCLTEPGI